jgi:hypothetical protein
MVDDNDAFLDSQHIESSARHAASPERST